MALVLRKTGITRKFSLLRSIKGWRPANCRGNVFYSNSATILHSRGYKMSFGRSTAGAELKNGGFNKKSCSLHRQDTRCKIITQEPSLKTRKTVSSALLLTRLAQTAVSRCATSLNTRSFSSCSVPCNQKACCPPRCPPRCPPPRCCPPPQCPCPPPCPKPCWGPCCPKACCPKPCCPKPSCPPSCPPPCPQPCCSNPGCCSPPCCNPPCPAPCPPVCPAPSPPNECGKALPPPGCCSPRCLQYMTGYYYYPYGWWFCGPYHVTNNGVPLPCPGPCGPCPCPCPPIKCCPSSCIYPGTSNICTAAAALPQAAAASAAALATKAPESNLQSGPNTSQSVTTLGSLLNTTSVAATPPNAENTNDPSFYNPDAMDQDSSVYITSPSGVHPSNVPQNRVADQDPWTPTSLAEPRAPNPTGPQNVDNWVTHPAPPSYNQQGPYPMQPNYQNYPQYPPNYIAPPATNVLNQTAAVIALTPLESLSPKNVETANSVSTAQEVAPSDTSSGSRNDIQFPYCYNPEATDTTDGSSKGASDAVATHNLNQELLLPKFLSAFLCPCPESFDFNKLSNDFENLPRLESPKPIPNRRDRDRPTIEPDSFNFSSVPRYKNPFPFKSLKR